uniref:Uncharacterized protein n=1 Tax=Strombidium inclinatum TaxID=197538 RepID=A0A7S3IRK0_9SPIT|mmetsp:Transcript_35822/g.54906  ORF Transcript_35822/g.54906 Transcript_35822/m.54906 type:complete len:225 (+) Transcript_35822:195-869(+)
MEWLRKDLMRDPWLTTRFRKYTCGPKRWQWKNRRGLRDHYRGEVFFNWMKYTILIWPLMIFAGRRARTYQGGVGVVPYQRFIHDWPNVKLGHNAQKQFWRYFWGTSVVVAGSIAWYVTDDSYMRDNYYTRPDFKPFPAMVENPTDYTKDTYNQLFQSNYGIYRDKRDSEEREKNTTWRFFKPLTANWDTKVNYYHGKDSLDTFQPSRGGFFPKNGNTLVDHMQS